MNKYVQERLYNSFFRQGYNNHVFGIQAQNIDAAGLSLAIRDSSINLNRYYELIDKDEYFRIWGQRNTLHIYQKKYCSILFVFNKYYGNWFKNKWEKKDKYFYEKNMHIAEQTCKKNIIINREMLIKAGVDTNFVDNWGGIFIDLCQRGYLLPTLKNGKTVFKIIRDMQCSMEDYLHIKKTICLLYFDTFGPATINDFAHWLSIDKIEAEEVIKNTDGIFNIGENYFYTRYHFSTEDLSNTVIITSKFDNIFLAYANKTWLAEKEFHKEIWIKSGLIEATIIFNGKVVGVWRYKKGKYINIYVKLFYNIEESVLHQIEEKLLTLNKNFWMKDCKVTFVNNF